MLELHELLEHHNYLVRITAGANGVWKHRWSFWIRFQAQISSKDVYYICMGIADGNSEGQSPTIGIQNPMKISAVINLHLEMWRPIVEVVCWWWRALQQLSFCVEPLSADTSKKILPKKRMITAVSTNSVADTDATKGSRTVAVVKCERQAPNSNKINKALFLMVWSIKLLTMRKTFQTVRITVVEINVIGTNVSLKAIIQTVIAQNMIRTGCSFSFSANVVSLLISYIQLFKLTKTTVCLLAKLMWF